MWELTYDVTCIAAWHSIEDEPWTVEALKDVQKDMVLEKDFEETYPFLPCYEKFIYTFVPQKFPPSPKPFIKSVTLIPQFSYSNDNLARIELVVDRSKAFRIIRDELSALIEQGDLEIVTLTALPKLPLEKYRKAKERIRYWIAISMPKPQLDESGVRPVITDADKTKRAMYLVFNMIQRYQPLSFFKDDKSKEVKPLYPELVKLYKFDKSHQVHELAAYMLANTRANIRHPDDLRDIEYMRRLAILP